LLDVACGSAAARIEASLLSKQRYVLIAFVLGALLVGITLQAALTSGFAQFAIPDNRLAGVMSTSTAIAVSAGFASLVALVRSRRAMTFAGEVVGELLRVTWPSRDEAVRASTTVVLTTLFTATLLAVYDFTWKNLADLILFTER
jgi:preprotein translocase subunit SecE